MQYTTIETDIHGRNYTITPPLEYRVKDIRPTHFIKDPWAKKYYEQNWRWVKMYTQKSVPWEKHFRYYLPRVSYSVWGNPKIRQELNMLESLQWSLRDYQYEAVKEVLTSRTKWWMVRSGEWTGKTRQMRALTRSLTSQVVIVVPTLNIQKWIVSWFKELGYTIYPGSWSKMEILPDRSYVVHQKTFLLNYDKFNTEWRAFIQDECHHAAKSIIDAINIWRSRVFWFTASPLRGEFWLEWFKMLYWTVHETWKESLPVKVFAIPKLRSYSIDYAMECKWDLSSDSYEIYRNLLYRDTTRTVEICNLALASYRKHKRVIIFTDRTEFAKLLHQQITRICQDTYLVIWETSKQNIQKRVENLDSFIIVGSIGCVWEWLDIPSLAVGILTFNTSNLKTIRQSAWRVRRSFWSKTHWYFIDIQDVIQIEWTKKYYWGISKRKSIYKELWFSYTTL